MTIHADQSLPQGGAEGLPQYDQAVRQEERQGDLLRNSEQARAGEVEGGKSEKRIQKASQAVRRKNGHSDLEVVETDKLVSILKDWLAKWEADRPLRSFMNDRRGYSTTQRQFTSGISYIVAHSNLSDVVVHRVLKNRTKHTALSIADELLTTIGMHFVLQDGTLPVLANPFFSQREWERRMAERLTD